MGILSLILTIFTVVELNCENMFDCQHDSLKNDTEWTVDGENHWTFKRYWRKLNRTAQTIIACGGDGTDWMLPDLVALCEVENDTTMRDLTQRSLLRKARYEYVMTSSPDMRGIDVALLYSPFSFRLINSHALRIEPLPNMRPTRDILYASGQIISGDTLHVFVVHAPSRSGGEKATQPYRMAVANRLSDAVDSIRTISPTAKIIALGDFNDYVGDAPLLEIERHDMTDISANATGKHGTKGTYRYRGRWESLDHIFVSNEMAGMLTECFIMDERFLLEKDKTFGGYKPRRNYLGNHYNNGFSDHLPLVARFKIQ